MIKIIDKLKSNTFNRVEKISLNCPKCGSGLFSVDNIMDMVMDGNMVAYCEKDDKHVFWQNAREDHRVLHLNPNSSETTFESLENYIWEDDKWNLIQP